MKTHLLINILFVIVRFQDSQASICGCKLVTMCYEDMVNKLQGRDEVPCVEDASIGTSTVMIYLKALKQFCPEFVTVVEHSLTYEGRHLYEVVLNIATTQAERSEDKPVIMIDAGQQAGTQPVGLALYIIEQLVACEENHIMMRKVKWVILPSTNPDGLEYGRYNPITWTKNLRPSEDGLSYGVDICRNFDHQWSACPAVESGFALNFPGLTASSENETMFIKDSFTRHKNNMQLYLSIRRDGHAILYPSAYKEKNKEGDNIIERLAAKVALRVNQRAGGITIFKNQSIYEANGKPHCGHSVDWAMHEVVPLAYELRVFIGRDASILSMFQQLPRGYENTLRLGYFSAIRELFTYISRDQTKSKSPNTNDLRKQLPITKMFK